MHIIRTITYFRMPRTKVAPKKALVVEEDEMVKSMPAKSAVEIELPEADIAEEDGKEEADSTADEMGDELSGDELSLDDEELDPFGDKWEE